MISRTKSDNFHGFRVFRASYTRSGTVNHETSTNPPHSGSLLVAATAALGAGAAPALGASYVPGEVIVKYKDDPVTGGAVGPAPGSKKLQVGRGSSVKATREQAPA